MNQRTCNIIACCKNNYAKPLPEVDPKGRPWANAVAAYMSEECACPAEDYKGRLLETVMSEALFDYMDTADAPGADLRRMFNWPGMGPEPDICDRIASVFSLATVRDKSGNPVNGFTQDLLAKSGEIFDWPDAKAGSPGAETRKDRKYLVETAMIRNAWYAAAAGLEQDAGPARTFGPSKSRADAIIDAARGLPDAGLVKIDWNTVDKNTAFRLRQILGQDSRPDIAYGPVNADDPALDAAKSALSELARHA